MNLSTDKNPFASRELKDIIDLLKLEYYNNENKFKEDPVKFFTYVRALYANFFVFTKNTLGSYITFYDWLKDISNESGFIRINPLGNILLQELYDVLYTDRVVDFSKYNYVDTFKENVSSKEVVKDTSKILEKTVKINVKLTKPNHIPENGLELIILFKKLGINGFIELLDALATKLSIIYI